VIRRLGIVAALVIALGGHAAAECAYIGLSPKVVTPAGARVPASGGIVVAAVSDRRGKLNRGDEAVQKQWRYRGRKTAPKIDSIAPGLAVMRIAPGTTTLVDAGGKRLIAVTGTKDRVAPPPTPKLVAVRHTEHHVGYHGWERVTVELDAAPPAGVIAVVLVDDKGTPRSWGEPVAGSAQVDVYSGGGCVPQANGTQRSQAGDAVRVMFVGVGGLVSAPSAVARIVKATPTMP